MPLTPDDITALRMIKDGADVFGYRLAQHLRRLNRAHPDLIEIVRTPRKYGPRDQHPYFGAVPTPAGVRAIGGAE